MDFRRKPPITPRELRLLSLTAFVAAIVLSILIGVNIGLSRSLRGGGEFYSAWQGARAVLFDHVDPYNLNVAVQSQQLAYGRAARSGENPFYLVIPFFILPVYFPFALISDALPAVAPARFAVDPSLVRGLWLMINEAALLATTLLATRVIEWAPRRLFLILLLLVSVFSFYSVTALIDGAPAILLGLLYFGILAALQSGRDELAGALLVLAFFHWAVGLFFVVLVLWRVNRERRYRVFYGFGMLLAVLLIASFLMDRSWLIPFLRSALSDLRSDYGYRSGVVLFRLWPGSGTAGGWILTAGLIMLLGYEWYCSRDRDFRQFVWTCCLTLAATPLLGFRLELGDLSILYPALALVFATAVERWHHGYWLNVLLALIVLLLPWGLFVRSVTYLSQLYGDLLFVFCPVFTILGLYWTRWWFIRPPRTWLDYARSSRS